MKPYEADKRTAKIRRLIHASVDQATYRDHLAAEESHDVDGFLNFGSTGDNIFGHNELLATSDFKSAAKNQLAVLFLSKNVAFTKNAPDLLADNDPTQRWRNNCVAVIGQEFTRQVGADLRCKLCVLQHHGTLKILPAVQSRAQDEVTVQQSAGFFKYL